ncbi:MAG TPA: hypothetical protein VFZ01_07600 [Geminicoccaceae bacterium]
MVLAFVVAGAPELSAQPQGPIKLFPDVDEGATPEPSVPVRPEGDAPAPGPRDSDARVRPGSPAMETPERPDDEGAVRVEGLEAPEVDAIGLPDGLDPAIWQAVDPERAVRLIGRLPVAHHNRPLQALTRRLLITGALFGDAASPGAMLIARVRGLVAMGALDDAAALLDQLPRQDVDTALTRASAEVALWRGDVETGCRLAEAVAPVAKAPFWGELMVFCRQRAGDADGAALALDLLRDAGQTDDRRFLALAEGRGAAGGGDAPWTALHVAMLEATGRPLPDGAAEQASGPLLAALAMRPELAPEGALELGERAFMRGAIDRDRLAEAYRAAAAERPADREPDDLPLPAARATVFAMLEAGAEPGEAARVFDRLWSRTPVDQRELTGAAFAPLLNELPALEELLFAAPAFARALLVAGYPGPASRWLDLLRKHAADDVTAREAAAALAPLLAIGGIRDGGARFGREAFEAWRASRAEDAPAPARLLALLEGAGARVPLDLWWLVEEEPGDGQPAPGVIWRILERARLSGATGDAILAGLHLLGGEPAAADREALIKGLGALREAGLAEEARRIATVAAVRSGL